MRKLAWAAALLLGVVVAAYAVVALFSPSLRSPVIQARMSTVPLVLTLHLIGGAIAISVGAFQVNTRIRSRFLQLHRWMGRAYVIAVVVSGVAGLMLATISNGELVAHFGFGTMAVLWLVSTLNAYRAATTSTKARPLC